ncbi:MAG: DUF3747 domain-containing protein [Cyanobium sp.]
MPRNYLRSGSRPSRRGPGLTAAIARSGALLPTGAALSLLLSTTGNQARGAALFAARPLELSRFAVLARPVGRDDWNLLVLEQLAASPACWQQRPDGLVDPSLNRFNFTGICNRYLDSNGYSLRVGEQDLANSHRLRIVQVGEELRLMASTLSSATDLTVARGRVPLRDRDAFVGLSLEPGWSLQRRVYEGRELSHLYFANGESLPVLLARLQAPTGSSRQRPAPSPPRLPERLGDPGSTPLAAVPARTPQAQPGQPIRLQVIPFRE